MPVNNVRNLSRLGIRRQFGQNVSVGHLIKNNLDFWCCGFEVGDHLLENFSSWLFQGVVGHELDFDWPTLDHSGRGETSTFGSRHSGDRSNSRPAELESLPSCDCGILHC